MEEIKNIYEVNVPKKHCTNIDKAQKGRYSYIGIMICKF